MKMEIRIALTNLGKYNEGELVFTWLNLPVSDGELSEAFKEIGAAEHFISDYEAPFDISEHTSITKLNDIAERLLDVDVPEKHGEHYDVSELIGFARNLEVTGLADDAMGYFDDIITTEQLDVIVEQKVQDNGWQHIKHFLSGIESMDDDYYYLNGYANVETIRPITLEAIVNDLLAKVKRGIDG